MYGSVPDWISIDLANAFLFTAFAVDLDRRARVRRPRRRAMPGLFGGAALWLVRLPDPVDRAFDGSARPDLSSVIITGYTWAGGL